MKNVTEVEIVEELDKNLPDEAKRFIVSEGFQLTREVKDMKVGNREQYEKACEIGIANANILKRLESLREALLTPIDLEKKRLNEAFKKAAAIFQQNDEKIRKAMESYQNSVKTEGIKTINTDLGRATIQERKDWEIGDETLIPKEYWKLDESKIGKVIRAGGSVPGITVKTVKSTAFVAA